MRVSSQPSHERLQYNSTAGREERSGLRCTSSHPARVHRSGPRMRPRIGQRAPRAPHRKCRRISLRYFNREVQPRSHPRNPGTNQPRMNRHVVFPRTFLGSPAGFGLAWRASYVRKRYLDDSRPGPYIALLRPPAHIRSFGPIHLLPIHACGAMFTPGARAIAGRVALMLLPACAVRAFCNLLIRTKMRART